MAALASTLACNGQIGTPGAPPSSVGLGPPVNPNLPVAACSAKITDVDATPLRRLTNADYLNSVTDLVGDVSALKLDFAEELTTATYPFLNKASEQETPPVLTFQYLSAAEKIAADVVKNRLSRVLTCDPAAAAGEQECAKSFVSSFAGKAYRRPIDADQASVLMGVWQVGRDTGGDFKSGVQSVITAVLQMPEFLYRFELSPAAGGKKLVPLDGWDMATRLSYLLWNSTPDDVLLAAAQAGKLQTAADISDQIMRMMNQPRAKEMVARFHEQWLQVGGIKTMDKDPMVFPKFNADVAAAMQQEVLSFVDDVMWRGDGKVSSLFTAPYTFMNDVLGKFYGVAGPTGTFARVDAAGLGMRPASGILTMGGLLAEHSGRNNTSPTHRGVFIRQALLCESLPPPPKDANPVPPVPKPNQTTRQALANHVADSSCAACHVMMDPIGFGFENFDASGFWRATEGGQTIDASGNIMGSDVAGSFTGPVELGAKLGASDQALACASTQWFRFAFGRDAADNVDGDQCAVKTLQGALKSGGALALVRAIPQTAPFLYRKVPEGGL
jgi:hypothetical protein